MYIMLMPPLVVPPARHSCNWDQVAPDPRARSDVRGKNVGHSPAGKVCLYAEENAHWMIESFELGNVTGHLVSELEECRYLIALHHIDLITSLNHQVS